MKGENGLFVLNLIVNILITPFVILGKLLGMQK